MTKIRNLLLAAAASAAGAAMTISAPAYADVKAGVDAWGSGDYEKAVAEWRAPAEAGDADAQFNMAQAYRLGRGVTADERQAEAFYSRAAAQGHLKAADNYGLLLFQDGRREQAMPYVQAASSRGDPRAQYLLGIAHFNGDLVEKDWERAYALLTLANSAGLPQAAPAINQMDSFIPLNQRQAAQTLAATLKREADAQRTSQLAAADLNSASGGAGNGAPARAVSAPPRTAPMATPPVIASRANEIPRPIATTSVSPSVVAAQAAVAEAARVTGTSSPAQAGADFARPAASMPAPARAATPAPTRVASAPAAAPRPAAPARVTAAVQSDGPWRVQLGAFSVRGNADRLWTRLSGNAALSGKRKILVPAGRVTRLQAGGFASRSAAQSACNAIKRGGQACIVTR